MSEKIKLTVYLSTYNQQEYIGQAIESILMQKTDFRFELLIADDCSTDGTQEIALEYQKKYPDIIKTYFTPVNIGGCKKLTECIEKGLFRGDYIANLEGDDYWLDENRLQLLVDFLDEHEEYSRVSHKRLVVDENDRELGYDISEEVLEKVFTINDFLEGRQYSDFGSVYRNYYRGCPGKYTPLFLASRNVCDFQDMFITQDFGPVYVLDKCLGVYRSRSVSGATNYNSITTQSFRCKENIRLAKAVEKFYNGRYDLSPMIIRNQKRLLSIELEKMDPEGFGEAIESIKEKDLYIILPELLYLLWRGKRKNEIEFLKGRLNKDKFKKIRGLAYRYAAKRIFNKITGRKNYENDKLRGYCNIQ